MAEIKKYDFTRNVFRKYGASHARAIATQVPHLLKEGEDVVSVEVGLSRLSGEIEKLFGNVAWLAKNGGGGGSGGGGGATEATGTLYVNGQPTEGQVIMGEEGLTIQLLDLSVSLTKSWNVTVNIGSVQVASGSVSYVSNTMFVSAARIAQALTNHQGRLQVVASYADDNNAVYGNASWIGTVIESTVQVSVDDDSTSLQDLHNKQLTVNYSVGYLGDSSVPNYRMHINVFKSGVLVNEYTEDIRIMDTTQQAKNIQVYGNLIDSDDSSAIGVYQFETRLTCLDNPELAGSTTSNFTLASDTILIASSTMSDDSQAPQDVSLTGSLVVEFTAYVQNLVSYMYDVRVGETLVAHNVSGRFGEKQILTLSVSGKEWAVQGQTTPVTISVVSGDKTATAVYYVEFVDSGEAFLSMRESATSHMLYQMRALDFNSGNYVFPFNNNGYIRGGSTYQLSGFGTPINHNDRSVIRIKSDGMPYLRLSNGSAMKVGDWELSAGGQVYHYNLSDFFPNNVSAINEFTISLCFKADYHADDYRTILFCGTLDATTEEISTGISIDAHTIYINNEAVYQLSDNTVNMVDITCTRTTTWQKNSHGELVEVLTYIIKVYVDGAITATRAITTGFPNLGDSIYLGCRHYIKDNQDVYTYLCDCEIYSLQVYDTALTDYDIMINRANNLALTSYADNAPQYSLIDQELHRNFCERNADNSIVSHLYDPETNSYTVDFLMSTQGGLSVLNEQNLQDYAAALGIPIMFIDVSTDPNWTFNAFSTQQTAGAVSLPATEGRRIQYWDPTETNSQVLTLLNMTIELQGTSTLADYVKNLNITAPDETLFVPKPTWLPEKTYTLKADVVDSSHSCNAAIGKFINEKFGYDEQTGQSYLPVPQAAIDNVYDTNYHRTQQPTGTLKHTIEGFPVLLIMKFYVTEESTVSITPLGIYSFNLGRNAYRNLGFKKLNSVTVAGVEPEITTFPFVAQGVTFNEVDGEANWIEIKDTTSIADMLTVKDSLPPDFDSSHGDFWQNDENIVNNRYEVRYPSGRMAYEYPRFRSFLNNIMMMPIEGCFTTNSLGDVNKPRIADSFDLYTCDSDGTNYVDTGVSFHMSTNPNDFTGNLGFNIESFIKYFVIACLNGLADNLGKNMSMRSWLGGEYYAGFYDLDCAFGGGNQGLLDISYDMWLKYLMNVPDGANDYGYIGETFMLSEALSNTVFSANHNKLWLSLDTTLSRAVFGGGYSSVDSVYTQAWYDLRERLQGYANAEGYKTFWDYFVDKYFIPQTGECGSLLFNYDYKLKYFLQFTDDSYRDTKALTKLHGRRISYTRTWLKRRITFLDTLFYWRDNGQTMNFRNDVNSRGANSVYSTPAKFPIKTNTSLVMYHSVGDQTKTFYFMKENRKTWMNTANSASDSILNWNFSNSPNVIELGDNEVKLKDMNVANLSYQKGGVDSNIDYVGYPSITDLDFSQNTRFNGFTLGAFKPIAMEGEEYDRPPISELRVMDFSNTAGVSFPLDLTYIASGQEDTWFQKLYKIDISGSTCISNLSIPEVPLLELKVAGSSILNFTLKNQAYLPEVDLSGCSRLQTVSLDNCGGYENFNIENLNNLTSCSIVDCANLETITINSCNVLRSINIENCPNLRSIIITNCPGLSGTYASPSVAIQDCTSLTSLSFRSCVNLTSFRISQANQSGIINLNLSNTKVSTISGDGASSSLLDLKAFTGLTTFNISGNASVAEIQFDNGATPIPLTQSFSGCINLERIYGNLSINISGIFSGCRKFSIHGDTLEDVRYFGYSVLNGGVVKLPKTIVPVGPRQVGDGVTNFVFGTTNLSSAFTQTACTTFDIYYVLERCANVTSISGCFRDLNVAPFEWTENADNSPNRDMFANCAALTNISDAFHQSGSKLIRLFSPDLTLSGDTITGGTDNGLLSPILANVENISTMFYGYAYIVDRRIFRHTTSNVSNLRSLSYFSPQLVVDNVNTLQWSDIHLNNILDWRRFINNAISMSGNMTGFFKQFTNPSFSSMQYVMDGTQYIDFDTLNNIPGQSFIYSFTSSYGKGSISTLASLFRNPATVHTINSAFRVERRITISSVVYKVNVTLSNNFLIGMSNLTYFGYNDSDLGSWSPTQTDPRLSSLCGYGMDKTIEDTDFPYRVFDSCPNLRMAACFFDSCAAPNLLATPELPGSLFRNTPQMRIVSGMFHNINFPYTLSSRAFENCPNLMKVKLLFAATESYTGTDTVGGSASSSPRKNYGTGEIPHELFYHGEGAPYTPSYKGVNGTVTSEVLTDEHGQPYTKYDINSDYYCIVQGSSVKWYDHYDTEVSESDVLTYPTYPECRRVNANIIDMTACFNRGNFTYYTRNIQSLADCIEGNPSYQTLDWIFEDKTFKNVSQDTDFYTEQWTFDGDPSTKMVSYLGETVKNLDADNDGVALNFYDVSSGGMSAGTLQYICAPDLLRYCRTSGDGCKLSELFRDAGHNVASPSYGNNFSKNGYGLRGRIVPYLLLPFKTGARGLNLDYMFFNCKVLSGYTYNNRSYMLPKTFFTHCGKIASMQYAFSGMTFDRDIDLGVFSSIESSYLSNISHIFYKSYYYNTDSTHKVSVNGIFSTLRNLSQADYAFATTYNGNNDEVKQTDAYIVFENVFPSGRYNQSGYNQNMYFSYIFAYYLGNVTHEAVKTTVDNTTVNNYKLYGQ